MLRRIGRNPVQIQRPVLRLTARADKKPTGKCGGRTQSVKCKVNILRLKFHIAVFCAPGMSPAEMIKYVTALRNPARQRAQIRQVTLQLMNQRMFRKSRHPSGPRPYHRIYLRMASHTLPDQRAADQPRRACNNHPFLCFTHSFLLLP